MGGSRPVRALRSRAARLAGLSLVGVVFTVAGAYLLMPLAVQGLVSAIDAGVNAGIWLGATARGRGRSRPFDDSDGDSGPRGVHGVRVCRAHSRSIVPRSCCSAPPAIWLRLAAAARTRRQLRGSSTMIARLRIDNRTARIGLVGLVCLLALGTGIWRLAGLAAQGATAPPARADEVRRQIERRFDVLPLTNGIVLTPKSPIPGVRSVRVLAAGGTISIDGAPVTGAELRSRLGAGRGRGAGAYLSRSGYPARDCYGWRPGGAPGVTRVASVPATAGLFHGFRLVSFSGAA